MTPLKIDRHLGDGYLNFQEFSFDDFSKDIKFREGNSVLTLILLSSAENSNSYLAYSFTVASIKIVGIKEFFRESRLKQSYSQLTTSNK